MSDIKLPPLPIPDGVGRHGDDLFYTYQMKAYARQCVLADRAARAVDVPDGWKLVPIEPTREMIDAYVAVESNFPSARTDWAAMLGAAPTQERGADDDGG